MTTSQPRDHKTFLQDLRLALLLMRDADSPTYLKLLPLLAVLYVIFPEGWLGFPLSLPLATPIDDVAVLYAIVKTMARLAPPDLVAKYNGKRQSSVVEGRYEVLDDEEELDIDSDIYINPELLKDDE